MVLAEVRGGLLRVPFGGTPTNVQRAAT
jgi:hypothetical protein